MKPILTFLIVFQLILILDADSQNKEHSFPRKYVVRIGEHETSISVIENPQKSRSSNLL